MKNLSSKFSNEGFLIFNNFLKSKEFKKTCIEINQNLESIINKINLKKIGGFLIGNLNVYPGRYAKKILDMLARENFYEIIENITKKKREQLVIRAGGNLVLPGKGEQHFHTDGNFNQNMYLAIIATSDVTNENAPTEIVLDYHNKDIPYWKFLLKYKNKKKILLKQGDLLIRKHCLWHRGTINKSNKPRLQIAFLIFDKKKNNFHSNIEGGNDIIIQNNFFGNSFYENFKEILYTRFKFIFALYKILKSLK